MMFGSKNRSERTAFNTAILTTFGKLDHQDIETIDGKPDLLLKRLLQRYQWSPIDARHKVERFAFELSNTPQVREPSTGIGLNA